MTDFASLLVPDRGQKARPIHLVDTNGFPAWLKRRTAEDRALIEAQRFDGKSEGGEPGSAALGWLLAQHRFDSYRSRKEDAERGPRVLVTGEAARIDEAV